MKALSDEIQRVAGILGAEYIRAQSMTEANIEVHNTSVDGKMIIFAGMPVITTVFEGAQIIDMYNPVDVYFLVRQTEPSMDGVDIDALLEIPKQMTIDFYANFDSPRDIPSYTLEAVTILDDFLIGYQMSAELSLYSKGCSGGT